MTTIAMHPVPRWSVIALEQIRSVGLRIRALGVLLAGTLLLYGAVATKVAMSDRAMTLANVRHSHVKFEFTPDISILIAYLALLLPALIWHEENPAKRMYHSAMPVARSTHALTKVFAGWVWLMAGTAVFLIVVISVDGISSSIEGSPTAFATRVAAWEWIVPFTAVTIAYALSSAAAVGAKTPAVWVVGPPVIYVGAALLITMLGAPKVAESMFTLFSGYYGAAAAIGGRYIALDAAGPRVVRWLVTTALWGTATSALLVAISRRRYPQ